MYAKDCMILDWLKIAMLLPFNDLRFLARLLRYSLPNRKKHLPKLGRDNLTQTERSSHAE